MHEPDATIATDHTATPLAGRRFLLADDADGDRMIYSRILSRAGADVTTACDGITAYRAWEDAKVAERPFHVAVIDFFMPGMNGAAVVALVRASGFEGPIIGLTAGLREEEDRLWRSAGCDLVVQKALSLSRFLGSILECRGVLRAVSSR